MLLCIESQTTDVCQPEPLFAGLCTHEHTYEDAGDHEEDSEDDVRSRCHPERVPVQRRVTVGRVPGILREYAERRIDPNISCTFIIYHSFFPRAKRIVRLAKKFANYDELYNLNVGHTLNLKVVAIAYSSLDFCCRSRNDCCFPTLKIQEAQLLL